MPEGDDIWGCRGDIFVSLKKALEKQFNSNAGPVVGGVLVAANIQPGESIFDY